MGRFIDLHTWKRREHFELFRGMAQPFFSVTVDIDATALRARCGQPDGPSFFLAALYSALRAANETEALRFRIRGDGVWRHEVVHITSTILREDDTFGFGRFELTETFADFIARGRREVKRVSAVAPLELPGEGDDDLIYHSTLPWFRFTAFTNALNGGADSIPRIVFGKCLQDGERWRMPVSVEVHHAVVDGLDVARFLERLEFWFNEIDL